MINYRIINYRIINYTILGDKYKIYIFKKHSKNKLASPPSPHPHFLGLIPTFDLKQSQS